MDDISLYLTVEDLSKEIDFTVLKSSGEEATYKILPKEVEEEGVKHYAVGIELAPKIEKGIGKSIIYAFKQEGAILKNGFFSLILYPPVR